METKTKCDSCGVEFKESFVGPCFVCVYCVNCGRTKAPFCLGCGCVMPKEGSFCQSCRIRKRTK